MKFKKRNIQIVDHSTGQTLDFPTFGKQAGEEAINELEQNVDNKIAELKSLVGTPLKASTASAMNNRDKIYVYTGNETGYTNGHWYYYDGTNWADGGVYNSTAVETDKTLSVENVPADAKKTGDEINKVMSELNDMSNPVVTLLWWRSGYIRGDDGNIASDPQSCYSNSVTSNGRECSISVSSGYKCKIAEYASNGSFIGIKVALTENPTAFTIAEGNKYRLQITKVSGNLSPSDVTSDIYTFVITNNTDKTLTKDSKSADAKAAGSRLHNLELNTLTKESFENGTVSSDLSKNESSTRISTVEPKYIKHGTSLLFESGSVIDKYAIILADETENRIITETGWLDNGEFTVFIDCRIIIVCKNSSDSPIDNDDYDATIAFKHDTDNGRLNLLITGDYTSSSAVINDEYIETNSETFKFVVPSGVSLFISEYDKDYNLLPSDWSYTYGKGTFLYPTIGAFLKFSITKDAGQIPSKVDISGLQVYRNQNADKVLEVPLVRGSYSRDSSTNIYCYSNILSNYSSYLINKTDIKPHGAKYMAVRGFEEFSNVHAYAYFSDSDHAKVDDAFDFTIRKVVPIPSNAVFVDIEIQTTSMPKPLTIEFYEGSGEEETLLRSKRKTLFADAESIIVPVNQYIFTTTRLMLPPNYDSMGKAVPLILWMDGSGNFTSWDGSLSSLKVPYLRYLRDEGFAVLSIFGWGNYFYNKYSNCGNSHPYPTPTGLACIESGVKEICDLYNIDANNIHVMSKSQGGACATYFATRPPFPIKSIGMFSPVVDYLTQIGEARYAQTRAAVAEDMAFVGDDLSWFTSTDFVIANNEERAEAFFHDNITQLNQCNEKWTGVIGLTMEQKFSKSWTDARKFWDEQYWQDPSKTDIYTDTDIAKIAQVPVKIWCASDDDNIPYLAMVEVGKQFQNSGCEVEIETLPRGTGGHSCADVGTNVVESITTALGITYTDIPIGWVENIEWIRHHMAKN